LCIDVREPYLNHIINTICNSANHNLISIIMTKKGSSGGNSGSSNGGGKKSWIFSRKWRRKVLKIMRILGMI